MDDIRDKLDSVNKKLERLDAEIERTSGHALNPINEIGSIRSRSKKRKRQIMERWDRQARDYTELVDERKKLEAAIKAEEQRPVKQAARATIEQVLRAKLQPGDVVETVYPQPATVVRCNAKSVTVETPSGFQDRVSWRSIKPLEWERMYSEWQAEQKA